MQHYQTYSCTQHLRVRQTYLEFHSPYSPLKFASCDAKMKSIAILSYLALVASVTGTVIPSSRTCLGEKYIPHFPPSSPHLYPTGEPRFLPRMHNPRARNLLARPNCRGSRSFRTLRLQRPREHRLQPARHKLGQHASHDLHQPRHGHCAMVRRSQW